MPLPAGIATVTCTFGKRFGVLGTQATITGTVELDRELTWEATGDVLDAYEEPFASSSGGFATLQLPYTDQAGFTDGSGTAIADFALIIKATIKYAGRDRFTVTKPIQLTSDMSGPIDIDLIDDGSITLPVTAPAPRVTSVAGETGVVTDEQLLAALNPALAATFVPRPEDEGTEGQTLVLGPDDTIVWGEGGGGGVPKFDQRTSAYNATPSSLRRARAALARATTGGATFHIAIVNDSTGVQSGTTIANLWHRVMRSLIASRGAIVHGTGMLSPDVATRASGPATTTGLEPYGAGIAGTGSYLQNGSGKTLTVTADTDQFRVMYQKRSGSGGTITATVDGGAAASINTSAAGGTGVFFQTYDVSQGAHTLVLTAPTDGNGFVLGVEARSSGANGGVKVSAFARGGKSSARLTDTGEGDGASSPAITALDCDLLFIGLGINDYMALGDAAGAQTPLATYKANIEAAIVTQRAAGGDVVLIGWLPQGDTTKTIPQAEYIQQLYDLADEHDVAVLDLQARWGSYAISDPLGYYADIVHPSDLGAADWGSAGYTLLNSVGLVL